MTTEIDLIAQAIRTADGNHDLGAGALAEALLPTVRALMAQAWEEGYDEGLDFETHSARDREWPARTPNPYRPTSPAPIGDVHG